MMRCDTVLLALLLGAQGAPDGWVRHAAPGPGFSPDRTCASHSRRIWAVDATADGIRVTESRAETTPHRAPFPIPFAEVLPPPPPGFPPPPPGGSARTPSDLIADLAKRAEHAGPSHVVPFGRGWLVGFSFGEYGGSLWWSPTVSTPARKLLNENVLAIVPLRSGDEAMVFVGLAHLNFDAGRVLRVRLREGAPEVTQVVDLGTEPQAALLEREGSVLILTSHQLRRLWPDGRMVALCDVDTSLLSPSTIAVAPGGEVYLGMKQYMARLTLAPSSARCSVEWFVPKDCRRFVDKDLDCVCGR